MKVALIGFLGAIIIQLGIIMYLSDNSNTKDTVLMDVNTEKPKLGDVITKVSKIDDTKVINIKKDEDNYIIEVEVHNNKEKFIETVKQLNQFRVRDFKFESNSYDISGTITIEN